MIDDAQAAQFERCVAAGGVVLFGADTVYGLACDPGSPEAVQRLYELKGRPPSKPAAVMFFALARALEQLPQLGPRTRGALQALLPGPLTLLLANPEGRYPLACGPDARILGVRVPSWPDGARPLGRIATPVLQSSANRAGEADASRLDQVPAEIRAGADLVLDAGPLPGVPSSVVDLSDYEQAGRWQVVREGALSADQIGAALT